MHVFLPLRDVRRFGLKFELCAPMILWHSITAGRILHMAVRSELLARDFRIIRVPVARVCHMFSSSQSARDKTICFMRVRTKQDVLSFRRFCCETVRHSPSMTPRLCISGEHLAILQLCCPISLRKLAIMKSSSKKYATPSIKYVEGSPELQLWCLPMSRELKIAARSREKPSFLVLPQP